MTEGKEWVCQKMTDDDDDAVGRYSNHGNLAVKVKPFPSEAQKLAPRSKITMSSKGAPYKIDFYRYVICPSINYII